MNARSSRDAFERSGGDVAHRQHVERVTNGWTLETPALPITAATWLAAAVCTVLACLCIAGWLVVTP